ncbi:hypothetical protein GLOIN_2v1822911 [Rhizophagus irregularis DAOM 181602=DAOM 197198]|nr:hypothetical protein GLOIN_2v1822911 [Rhizophagus irregularis DAOM 181602=DAOM 197198]
MEFLTYIIKKLLRLFRKLLICFFYVLFYLLIQLKSNNFIKYFQKKKFFCLIGPPTKKMDKKNCERLFETPEHSTNKSNGSKWREVKEIITEKICALWPLSTSTYLYKLRHALSFVKFLYQASNQQLS